MYTIDLAHLHGYTEQDIYEFLQLQQEDCWCIETAKLFREPIDENDEVGSDYYAALYIGEQLAPLSPDFSYKVPSSYSTAYFSYTIQGANLQQLSKTLYYLLKGIIYHGPDDPETSRFWFDEEQFWKEVCSGKTEPVCQGLLAFLETNDED